MRKPTFKTAKAKLDKQFSLWIRNRDKDAAGGMCLICVRAPIEQCFHFMTRAKFSVRWDARNAIGSCAGCNIKYEYDQIFIDLVFSWYKRKHGEEAWEALKRDGNRLAKYSAADLLEMCERYKF